MNKVQAEAVKRAIRAAESAIAETLPLQEAANNVGASRRTTGDAYLVLTHGTADEISIMRETLVIRSVVEQVRQRLPKAARPQRAPILPEAELERRAFDSEIWDNLAKGMMGLVSLPKPTEVVKICRSHPARRKYTDDNILTAHEWLTEFLDVWTQ